eukprot:jgi/Psemu1/306946/fgenesh1_kg.290_\
MPLPRARFPLAETGFLAADGIRVPSSPARCVVVRGSSSRRVNQETAGAPSGWSLRRTRRGDLNPDRFAESGGGAHGWVPNQPPGTTTTPRGRGWNGGTQ